MSLLKRFEGDANRPTLIEALKKQCIGIHDDALAGEFASKCELRELAAGEVLIKQGEADTDLYLILAGQFEITMHGTRIIFRGPGTHIGEMSILQPAEPRSATATATAPSVVAKISMQDFERLAESQPRLWKALGAELANRLRGRYVRPRNPKAKVFIGSSTEAKKIAVAIASNLAAAPVELLLWTSPKVFLPSQTFIESLEKAAKEVDFAVLVLHPDDIVISRGKRHWTTRDNVILEFGLFLGALSRKRSFLVCPERPQLKLPSDILNVSTLRYRRPKANADLPKALQDVSSQLAEIFEQLKAI